MCVIMEFQADCAYNCCNYGATVAVDLAIKGHKVVTLLSFLCWEIWKVRNKIIFEDSKIDVITAGSRGFVPYRQFSSIKETPSKGFHEVHLEPSLNYDKLMVYSMVPRNRTSPSMVSTFFFGWINLRCRNYGCATVRARIHRVDVWGCQ